MSIDERARHRLFVKLESVLGAEEATTLMEHLPPVGWADVATKQDLRQVDERIRLRFEAQEQRFAAALHGLEAGLLRQMNESTRTLYRTVVLANAASVLTVAGLAFAAARLV